MSNHMPDSITRVLLAALNAADEVVERNADLASQVRTEMMPVVRAFSDLTKVQVSDTLDDRQNRFVATIRLSLDKSKSAF
ncbi:hypothetical protein JQ580_23710 [Bradyrhizobium japonicum]|uniref:hypothetical protein n=1 Tax=Bradyrhizobium japonicum TaxID=375 RepID=UPI001BADCB08|nr:hypothetical protein [Bradyrhizobium japonicum]MBR0993735.1 hypothetical protein [Bradyrhizobium japonicum]